MAAIAVAAMTMKVAIEAAVLKTSSDITAPVTDSKGNEEKKTPPHVTASSPSGGWNLAGELQHLRFELRLDVGRRDVRIKSGAGRESASYHDRRVSARRAGLCVEDQNGGLRPK